MIFVPQIATVGTRQRRGVVLLVVMALLALFAAVGLTFVFYADATATASQDFRERATNMRADVSPELLLAYYLAQLIYDVDDTNGAYSAMRGHSLARAMYGSNATNNVPYSGIGRAHYNEAKLGGADAYDYVNH